MKRRDAFEKDFDTPVAAGVTRVLGRIRVSSSLKAGVALLGENLLVMVSEGSMTAGINSRAVS